MDIQIDTVPNPPSSMRPFAYGTCNGNAEANESNLGNCSTDVVTGLARQVYFSSPLEAGDDSYIVVITPSSGGSGNGIFSVCGKDNTRFLVCEFRNGTQEYPGNFDFVVFNN